MIWSVKSLGELGSRLEVGGVVQEDQENQEDQEDLELIKCLSIIIKVSKIIETLIKENLLKSRYSRLSLQTRLFLRINKLLVEVKIPNKADRVTDNLSRPDPKVIIFMVMSSKSINQNPNTSISIKLGSNNIGRIIINSFSSSILSVKINISSLAHIRIMVNSHNSNSFTLEQIPNPIIFHIRNQDLIIISFKSKANRLVNINSLQSFQVTPFAIRVKLIKSWL